MRDIFIPLLVTNILRMILRGTYEYWGWRIDILFPLAFIAIYVGARRKHVAYFFASLGQATHDFWFKPIERELDLIWRPTEFSPFEVFVITMQVCLITHIICKGTSWIYRWCAAKLAEISLADKFG